MAAETQSAPAALRWRCRRGMKELDILLERYLQHRYPVAPPAERQAFQTLVDLQDPDLLRLVLDNGLATDPETKHVLAHLTGAHR
jgi:antitoxin CptB